VIALTDDRGRLLWVSAARPGRTSEITACRHDHLTAHLRATGLGAIADLGFIGLDDNDDPDADYSILAALRSYRQATGHLAPRQDQVWGEGEAMVPVGQHIANLRRKGGLGKDQERAAERAQQPTAINPDWNCPGVIARPYFGQTVHLVDASAVAILMRAGCLA
jgi:hypothetical protein